MDKRTAGAMRLHVVSPIESRDLWRGNDLAARIIEEGPTEELRNGFELHMDDKDLAEQIMTALEEIPGPAFIGNGLKKNVLKARCFENAYGGGAIFPVINDAIGSLAEPLDEGRITKIERLQVFEPRELRPTRKYEDPASPKFGEWSHYQVMPISGARENVAFVEIHESRLILFPGIRTTREDLNGAEYGWGDNVLTRVWDVLNDFELTFGSAAALIQDFSQAILKLKDLARVLSEDGGDATARLSEMNRWRSSLRAVVIDSEDSFSRESTSLAGLAETMDRFMFRLAAAARMPVTKLMGMAPAGLNATGESDSDNWDKIVASGQEHITPMIERLIKLFVLSADSPTKGKEPPVWSIVFCPLAQPSEAETAATRKTVAETDAIYIDRGVYSSEEVAQARAGGDTYSMEMMIDFEARDQHEAAIQRATDAGAATGAADPNAPSGLPAGAPAAATAFNGAQVSSMVEVIKAAIAGEIPRESAAAILEIAFPIDAARAQKLLGPQGWKATPSESPIPPGPPSAPPPPAPPEPADHGAP